MSEIRGFYALQTMAPVSVSAQALWHYLMYRANGVWWAMPLALRSDEICGALGLGKSAFKRARQELTEHKLLVVEPQGGRRPSLYYVMSAIRQGSAVRPALSIGGRKTGE
jgi:hypothetical protein